MNKELSLSVSIVIPVYNETCNLNELIIRTLAACRSLKFPFEIILVDDGSRDGSDGIIIEATKKHAGEIIGVLLNRNYGQHAAVMAGFAQAKGEIIVTLDADLQNPPEEIPRLVNKMNEGFDVVGSIRTPRQDSLFRRFSSMLVNKMTASVTGIVMHDYGCMLRAYRRHVVQAMLQCQERSTFIPVLANSFARKTTEIEVKHTERKAGGSKYSLWKLVNLQFDLLTSITTLPLRILSFIGVAVALIGVGLGILILILRILWGPEWAAKGVFTLFAILFIFVGGQFTAMGFLGEYIGRTYVDVRARPRYFIQSVEGKSKLDGGNS
ncbi:MAG: glycosyltransferase [Kiritimatiellia bacterium]|nr:glycosyltransferase [Kiritimatiellia bacterium]